MRKGRKPLPPERRKTEKLWLLETAATADAICRAAIAERIAVSEWLRRAAADRLARPGAA